MNAIELSLFTHRLAAICEEMGATLKRSAISPNIKDREDYSCALFDRDGELVAQAAHIPVHLGSMAYCMHDVVQCFNWREGDVIVFNDPFLGGTHLPDITVVMPVFADGSVIAFAATRAHHADIGGRSPGSMGLESSLADEGLIIAPQYWFDSGHEQADFMQRVAEKVGNPDERYGDLNAQRAACRLGKKQLINAFSGSALEAGFVQLMAASERYGRNAITTIPDGSYTFADLIEDDGLEERPLHIKVNITIDGATAIVDFSGTSAQCTGPLNCPLSVTAASVFYAFRCLMPEGTPQTAAIFRPIRLQAAAGCFIHALPGAAVAAGSVESSQRIVDVVLGALAKAVPDKIPAAAQGTMNNVIFAGERDGQPWVYYETLAGGMGAHARAAGLTAVQCHMTNTKNSSIEVLEMHYPLRICSYAIRADSGGEGLHRGGDGLIREWEVLQDCHLSLLTERRKTAPYGLQGGMPATRGSNHLLHDGLWRQLDSKCVIAMQAGDRLRIETPGGGGYGELP